MVIERDPMQMLVPVDLKVADRPIDLILLCQEATFTLMCLEVTAIPIGPERVPALTNLMAAETPPFREVTIPISLESIATAILLDLEWAPA
jgi:hypothetical protein